MAFADNLRQLPAITHIAALHLLDDSGAVVATIPNAMRCMATTAATVKKRPLAVQKVRRWR